MKTPISALQEVMLTLGPKPEYNCIAEIGARHNITFVFECVALGISVTGKGRKKKEAKQEAARKMLLHLSNTWGYELYSNIVGVDTPPPLNKPALVVSRPVDYISLVKEMCEKHHWDDVFYAVVSVTGVPSRRFVVQARFGVVTRRAAAATIKAARHLAAEEMYAYLWDLHH